DALKDWGLSHRFAGSGHRAAIGNIVYDALRRRRSAAWLFDDGAPRALAFGALRLEWEETPESLPAQFEGDRFAPQPLSEAERAALGARSVDAAPAVLRADCAGWGAPLPREAYGEGWVAEARALAARPPLDLRVNRLRVDRDEVEAALRRTG